MSRGELARRIGEVCRDIIGTAPVPAPFTYDDSRLAAALLQVVEAFNTHGDQGSGPIAHAYWHGWHDGMDGAASDPHAFRDGAEHLEAMIAERLNQALPAEWEGDQ